MHLFRLSLILVVMLTFEAGAVSYEPISANPPKPMREMRGAWIATVSNIDWPSTNTLTTAQQKAELIEIFDRARQLKLNTLIFQVRPGCDALYASRLEPWSEYLTGTMGKAPVPFYDPLEFAITEAHKRGLDLHAWFNPYRARHGNARSPIANNHISRTRPQLVKQYGRSLWLDPGEKEVQDYSLSVILDVIRRYDVDGVHIDDYFYPYVEKDAAGHDLAFPDDVSWRRFGANGKLDRDDWRRENVDAFVRRIYEAVRKEKSWVRFGVSPFGIWRPGNPPQIQGFDAYAKLYADSRKWLANGWVDYFAPQLYWAIDAREQSFPVLLNWWASQNPYGRSITPGMDSTKTSGRWQPAEIVNQIRLTRKQAGASGHIHWNMKALMRNRSLDETLERDVYSEPALVPALARSLASAPGKPTIKANVEGRISKVSWEPATGQRQPWLWLLQSRKENVWKTLVIPGAQRSFRFESPFPDEIAVSAVDRTAQEGKSAAVMRKQ